MFLVYSSAGPGFFLAARLFRECPPVAFIASILLDMKRTSGTGQFQGLPGGSLCSLVPVISFTERRNISVSEETVTQLS